MQVNFAFSTKPQFGDNFVYRACGSVYFIFFKNYASSRCNLILLLLKKITLLTKFLAVSAHEIKPVSWASQLLLQTLGSTICSPKRLVIGFAKTNQVQNKNAKSSY
jgi:hypothetical protein